MHPAQATKASPDYAYQAGVAAPAVRTALLDEVTSIVRETTELVGAAIADLTRFTDNVIGSVPTPLSKETAGNSRVEGPRGTQLEAGVRYLREAVYEIRNQINRLEAI